MCWWNARWNIHHHGSASSSSSVNMRAIYWQHILSSPVQVFRPSAWRMHAFMSYFQARVSLVSTWWKWWRAIGHLNCWPRCARLSLIWGHLQLPCAVWIDQWLGSYIYCKLLLIFTVSKIDREYSVVRSFLYEKCKT